MKTSVEKVDSIRRTLKVDVPAAAVDAAYAKAFEEVRKEAKVSGFRKGKVPDAILLQRYGDEIRQEAAKRAVQESYPEAVKESGEAPLGDPRIETEGPPEKGKPFCYTATFEVYPEVTISGYEKLPLEKEKVAVTDEEVEDELLRLQQRMTQLEPIEDGAIGPGTVSMIDFTGTAGGEDFPGSEAENYVVDFGSGNLLEEFELQIKGMKANEERDIEFDYPRDFFKKDLAGKRGKFKIKVKEVRRKVIPELTDEFAKELGNYTTLGEVRRDLKKRIAEYKEMVEHNRLKEQAIRSLIEKNKKLEVPYVMVDAELGNMLEQLKKQWEQRGQKFDANQVNVQEFVKANVGEAENRARGFLIVDAIAKQEEVEVADEEVEARVSEIAQQNRKSVDEVRQYLEQQNLLGQMRAQMRFDKTLELVVGKAKVKESKPKKEKKPAKMASKTSKTTKEAAKKKK